MTKRRGNGEGSIFQRGDGRWTATITVGLVEGPVSEVIVPETDPEPDPDPQPDPEPDTEFPVG